MASKSIDWDEVLLTKDPKKKEIEVSFKKIDGDGNLVSFGDEPGTPPGTGEKNCSNFISSTVHTEAYPWQDGQFFEFYVTITQPLLYDLTIGLIYSFPGDEAAVVAPSSVVLPAGARYVHVTGNLAHNATELIPFPIDINIDYSIDGNDPCLGDFGLVIFDENGGAVVIDPPNDPGGNGGPVDPQDPFEECGDTSCTSWSDFASNGYDANGDNWAGRVIKFFNTEDEYAVNSGDLLIADQYGYGKVYPHFDGTPSEQYACDGYFGLNDVAINDITTVDFAASHFASSVQTERSLGGNGACGPIRVITGTQTGAPYISNRTYDLGITGAGTGIILDANRGLSGYGMVVGAGENYFKNDASTNIRTPWTDLTGGVQSGSGTGNDPGALTTFLKLKRNYTFFVAGDTQSGLIVEPTPVAFLSDGTGRLDQGLGQKPIKIGLPDFRVYQQTYDTRRSQSATNSLLLGSGYLNIYSDAIYLVLDSNDTTPEENAWSQKQLPFPNDGTATGWYTIEMTLEAAVQGPFDSTENTFYYVGYHYYDLSRVNIYKNGNCLLYNYPCGADALRHANITGNPLYVPRSASNLAYLDKDQFFLYGYRQLTSTGANSAFNPNGLHRTDPFQDNEDKTMMMMYDGPDAVNLPKSEFGRRWSRQMGQYIAPSYCSRIP